MSFLFLNSTSTVIPSITLLPTLHTGYKTRISRFTPTPYLSIFHDFNKHHFTKELLLNNPTLRLLLLLSGGSDFRMNQSACIIQQLLQLSRLVQVRHDITSTNKISFDKQLRECRPVPILSNRQQSPTNTSSDSPAPMGLWECWHSQNRTLHSKRERKTTQALQNVHDTQTESTKRSCGSSLHKQHHLVLMHYLLSHIFLHLQTLSMNFNTSSGFSSFTLLLGLKSSSDSSALWDEKNTLGSLE